ncbi:MAG: ABC transporter permease [Clostridiales Family XIII bacterium]|jgi:peptide/nickel transport system permease protein|nr:ABC transporter permease [Clostridiales Family XIII bacterium]
MHTARPKYIASIAGRMLLLLFLVSILSFTLIVKAPIDPLLSYVGAESTLSEEAKAEIARHWGLDAPLPARYATWVKNLLHGDLGMSVTYKRPVRSVIGERFSYSVVLMLLAWVFSGLLGYAAGIFAGFRRGGLADRGIKLFCLVLQSAPTFWLGLLILSFFSVKLGLFPFGMAVPAGKLVSEITLGDRIHHLILPLFTLTIVSIGKITLFTRQKLIEIMNSDYILFARARGESDRQLVFRHILRNTALPAVTLQFSSFSELFGGMALAETVFSYPGVGTATTAAALNGDAPLLLGIALISALFVFSGNLIANILYGVVDPRLREGGDYV